MRQLLLLAFLLVLVGFVSADCTGEWRCSNCLGLRDSNGLKCQFSTTKLTCLSYSEVRASDKAVEYISECSGVRNGKPPANSQPARPSTPAATTPATPATPTPATPATPAPAAAAPAAAAPITIDLATATKACNTHFYRGPDGKPSTNPVVFRVGCKFTAQVSVKATSVKFGAVRPKDPKMLLTGITSTSTKNADGTFTLEVTLGDAQKQTLPIGEIRFVATDDRGAFLASYPVRIFLIFNPYVPGPTYIQDQYDRKDWIENEAGAMWVGSNDKPYWSPWGFDQFDFYVWSVTFDLLDSLSVAAQKDATLAVRELSKMIADKILSGKWGDTGYEDADTPPWQWTSSSAIFKVVATQKRRAKYGQCMIFSCVTASVFRAIGIAARSNTGYDFVQEKGGDMTVRIYWKPDDKGNYVWDTAKNDAGGEKLWNFHAWTIAYIARPDLGINEVQPQIADGTWHAGPGAISLFKKKDLKKNYDLTSYEPCINSKVIYINQGPKGNLEWPNPFIPVNKVLTTQVEKPGSCSRTTNPDGTYNSLCWEDLVTWYKSVVPKPENRPASFMQTAAQLRFGQSSALTPGQRQRTSSNGVKFTSYMPLSTRLGNDFVASLEPVGTVSLAQLQKIVGSVHLQTYDGRTLGRLKDGMASGSKPSLRMTVATADFKNVPKNQIAASSFAVAHFSAYDNQGKLIFFEERKMALEPPKVNMLCGSKTIAVGKKLSCNINFYNPMPFPIKATMLMTISGNTDVTYKPKTITIPAKAAGVDSKQYRGWFENVQYLTTTPGKHMVIVSVKTDALNEVKGALEVTVTGTVSPNFNTPATSAAIAKQQKAAKTAAKPAAKTTAKTASTAKTAAKTDTKKSKAGTTPASKTTDAKKSKTDTKKKTDAKKSKS